MPDFSGVCRAVPELAKISRFSMGFKRSLVRIQSARPFRTIKKKDLLQYKIGIQSRNVTIQRPNRDQKIANPS